MALVFVLSALAPLVGTLPNVVQSALTPAAAAHGFNANRVRIMRTLTGKHRVIVQYSHVEIGEYREAHVDFDSENEAVAVYQQLAQGADFFLGDVKKSIHFHKPPQKNIPY